MGDKCFTKAVFVFGQLCYRVLWGKFLAQIIPWVSNGSSHRPLYSCSWSSHQRGFNMHSLLIIWSFYSSTCFQRAQRCSTCQVLKLHSKFLWESTIVLHKWLIKHPLVSLHGPVELIDDLFALVFALNTLCFKELIDRILFCSWCKSDIILWFVYGANKLLYLTWSILLILITT